LSEAGELQGIVEILAAHVPQGEILELVGVGFDNPLSFVDREKSPA
jgi:hypothetical protein